MTSSFFDVQTLAELNGVEYKPAGAIFAVDGTSYIGAPGIPPPGAGFSSDLVYSLMGIQDGLWASYLIPYPAITFPMGPSVDAGVANLSAALLSYAGSYYAANQTYDGMVIVLSGYSQGAMVTGKVWRLILDPTSNLGFLKDYVYRIYQFGDPYRCPGIAHGNELAGQPLPPEVDSVVTGGIGGPEDLTPDESNVLAPDGHYVLCSFVNPGDLYADCPTGDNPWEDYDEAQAGAVEYSIFKVVQNATFIDVISVAADLFMPVGMVEAIINGLTFLAQGAAASHYHYEEAQAAAVQDCLALGNSLPHQSPQ